jgi:hypothetical protein
LTCPPITDEYPALGESITLQFPNVVPAGTGEITLPLNLVTPIDVASFVLPLQLRIGGEVPTILSFTQASVFDNPGGWLIAPEFFTRIDATSGTVLVAGTMLIEGQTPLYAGRNALGELQLSVEPADYDREITGSWGEMYPIQALPGGYPQVGLIPQVLGFGAGLPTAARPTSALATAGSGFLQSYVPGIVGQSVCCVGSVGNINGDPAELVTIGDLSMLIDLLFINIGDPDCKEEANVNGDPEGMITIGDVSALIDHLFINRLPLLDCGDVVPGGAAKSSGDKSVEVEAVFDGERTTVSIKSDFDIRGVQLELVAPATARATSLVDGSIDLFQGNRGTFHRIGLFDFQGQRNLASGKRRLLSFDGRIDITGVLVSDEGNNAYTARIVQSGRNLPTSYSLDQNYPNPFNPSTVIGFALLEPGEVRLAVYNITGQLVKVLVDGSLEAGYHEVEWDASRTASGVYFYRLTAGTFSDAKKMLMLK